MKSTVLCDIRVQRFPHDYQDCELKMESWSLKTHELILNWESEEDRLSDLNNTLQTLEYKLVGISFSTTTTVYNMNAPVPRKLFGNYSTLLIKFRLQRYTSQYYLDYYIPSILLVSMSWVSFWLEPSAIPGRTTLGTGSWLTYINLHKNINDNVSRVHYICVVNVLVQVDVSQ